MRFWVPRPLMCHKIPPPFWPNLAAFYDDNIPRETKHMVRRAPAVKIVTKICSFVTIVQGTFLTFSVVRY